MLVGWADELASTVQYPANQICTDDFTGPLANNTNLGAKGVIALEAFAQLCVRAGAEAGGGTNCSAYSRMAAEFAMTWQQHAYTDKPQPHYKMSFNDVPGIVDSWSLKCAVQVIKCVRYVRPDLTRHACARAGTILYGSVCLGWVTGRSRLKRLSHLGRWRTINASSRDMPTVPRSTHGTTTLRAIG